MQEKPMSQVAARSSAGYSVSLSTAFKVVGLFCLLGLTLSAAILPMIAPERITWILSHIE
jgi:hypothetical protein